MEILVQYPSEGAQNLCQQFVVANPTLDLRMRRRCIKRENIKELESKSEERKRAHVLLVSGVDRNRLVN